MPLADYTTAELGLMLLKHQERRVILTQFKIKEIKEEIVRRENQPIIDRIKGLPAKADDGSMPGNPNKIV